MRWTGHARSRDCCRPFHATSAANSAHVAAPPFARCQTPCSPSISRSSAALTRCGTYVGEIVTSSAAIKWLPFDKRSEHCVNEIELVPRTKESTRPNDQRLRKLPEHLSFSAQPCSSRKRSTVNSDRVRRSLVLPAVENQIGRECHERNLTRLRTLVARLAGPETFSRMQRSTSFSASSTRT